MDNDHITVTMPYYRSPETVRRAVDAVLGQTHTNLTLIVTNDGDQDTPPWPYLADIDDPRLVRFDLPHNRGRYFADAVTLTACDTPWFAIHDADDEADPTWLSTLQRLAQEQNKKVALTPIRNTDLRLDPPKSVVVPIRKGNPALDFRVRRAVGDRRRPFRWIHLASWIGVWDTRYLASLGGPNPSYRVGYDTLLTRTAILSKKAAISQYPLYTRYKRDNSLTTREETGIGSDYRQQSDNRLHRIWEQITPGTLTPQNIRLLSAKDTPDSLVTEVKDFARELEKEIASPGGRRV